MSKTKKKAFTLIELLVVIAIIGVLAALALANYNASRRNARDGRRLGDIKNIMGALEQYYNDNGTYPRVNGWVNTWGGSSTWLPGMSSYMDRVPIDPSKATSGCLVYSYNTDDCSSSSASPLCYSLDYSLEWRDDNKAIGNRIGWSQCSDPQDRYRVSR